MHHRLPDCRPLAGHALRFAGLATGLALLLGGCHFERVASATAATHGADPVDNFENKTFDAKTQVADIWDSKVIPAIGGRAGSFADLQAAMKADVDGAGKRFGYRERGEGAPWVFSTRIKGRIVEVNTESSAATVGVDVDNDGKPDARIQIGPILRGTAIRDALPFISFTHYTNQVEFAQLANAFNDQAFRLALKPLKRDALNGRSVDILGVFSSAGDDELPVVTPVQFALGAAP